MIQSISRLIFILSLFQVNAATAQKTYILIQSNPGVEVYIDTSFKGVTSPGKGELFIEDVLQGQYNLTFRNNGNRLEKSIFVEDANERILFIDLKNRTTEDRSPVNRPSKYALLEYTHPHIWHETLTDPRDGQVYRYCRIGEDDWMAENLNYMMWGKSFAYPRDTIHSRVYGRLYQWSHAKKACPPGWHLPTDDDWCNLERNLYISNSLLDSRGWRETGESTSLKSRHGWLAATKSSDDLGFAAFPGGFRDDNGLFFNEGYFAYFWTATESDENTAWYRVVTHDLNHVGRFSYDKEYSFSIRCVKDRD